AYGSDQCSQARRPELHTGTAEHERAVACDNGAGDRSVVVRRVDATDLRHRLALLYIPKRSPNDLGVVSQRADRAIAGAAKQTAHDASLVVMVDREALPCPTLLAADRADAALLFKHGVVHLQRDAIAVLQREPTLRVWVLFVPTLHPEPLRLTGSLGINRQATAILLAVVLALPLWIGVRHQSFAIKGTLFCH